MVPLLAGNHLARIPMRSDKPLNASAVLQDSKEPLTAVDAQSAPNQDRTHAR